MPLVRFHENRGVNIELRNDNQVARRSASFANAITFTDRPLKPGELFLVEIEEQEPGWSGHLRCGLTQHHPASLKVNRHGDGISELTSRFAEFPIDRQRVSSAPTIPQYSMPDLTNMGKSWIYAITKYHNKVQEDRQGSPELGTIVKSDFIKDSGTVLKIGCSEIPKHCLVHDFIALDIEAGLISGKQQYFATSVGSRIGVTYNIIGCTAYMHFIINGEDQGASIMEDAKPNCPFYGIVDVYGTSKQVRLVQLVYAYKNVAANQSEPGLRLKHAYGSSLYQTSSRVTYATSCEGTIGNTGSSQYSAPSTVYPGEVIFPTKGVNYNNHTYNSAMAVLDP